ncbi:MAG: SDR family oxidoreductase [Gammaproteobacteria bacterium]|nr:SDR family oxidoreductase [Gammaproteobacteria bacterium]
MSQLAGRRVVLTGASGGIGAELAAGLVDAGARVLLLGRDPAKLEALAATLGPTAIPLCHDLRDPGAGEPLADRVGAALGGVDLLIHCAGLGRFGPFDQLDDGAITALVETNLTGPIRLTRSLLPLLLQSSKPRLVLVGSVLGWLGYPGQAVYSASKAGLQRFGEALRREYSDQGLDVLHIAPRAARTEFNNPAQRAANRRLKVAEDAPEAVALAVLHAIVRDRRETVLGFPERLLCRLNQLLPRVFDRALVAHAAVMRDAVRDLADRPPESTGH